MKFPGLLLRLLFLFPLRLSLLTLHLVLSLFLCFGVFKFTRSNTRKEIVRWWLHVACRMIGIRIKSIGTITPHSPVCIVANHISWLDIVVLGGTYPVSFLSKDEIRHWPIIGYIGTVAGTLYIKRGSGSTQAIQQIKDQLEASNNISIFPEATTGTGEKLQRFYPRMFAALMDGKTHIQPIALIYPPPEQPQINTVNPRVPLQSSSNFLFHALKTILAPTTPVVMRHTPAFLVKPGDTRESVAKKAYLAIDQELQVSPPDREAPPVYQKNTAHAD